MNNTKCRFTMRLIIILSIYAQLLFGVVFENSSAKFQWIGKNMIPNAISPEGRVVVGGLTPNKAFRWDERSGLIELQNLTPAFPISQALDVSRDGAVIVGYSEYDTIMAGSSRYGKTRAVYWTPGGAITAIASMDGSMFERAYGIDASGMTIVGQSDSGSRIVNSYSSKYLWSCAKPVRWQGGSGSYLPSINNRTKGTALGISLDGTVAFGHNSQVLTGGPQAVKWTSSGMVDLGFSPVNYSKAVCASSDGNIVVAIDQYNGPNRSYKITGTTRTSIGDSTNPTAITYDGKRIVGSSTKMGIPFALIWDAGSNSSQALKTFLEQKHGLDLGSAQLYQATAMSSDGDVIVGYGYDSLNQMQAFRIVLDTTPIKVWNPDKNVLWLAGTTDTIRWSCYRAVQHVNIYLSVDSGRTKKTIAENISASASGYAWKVPDTIVSAQCIITITASTDTTISGNSKVFRIRGKRLTRINTSGKYEPFIQGEHDFSFANEDRWLWPSGWYNQYNYQGVDPITKQDYSKSFDKPFANAKSSEFPDWPLFVKVFGETACYHKMTPSVVYKERAVEWWKSRKGEWNGSCWGFTVASLLAFDNKAKFVSSIPEMKSFTVLNELACDDSVRYLLNMLWLHQYSADHQAFILPLWDMITPTQTVRDINDMLISDKRDDRFLGLTNCGTAGGSHVVVPIALSNEESVPGVVFIHVYDNNCPTDKNAKIWVDTLANDGKGSWVYPNLVGWGGNKNLFLLDLVSTYYTKPKIPTDPDFYEAAFGSAASKGSHYCQIYTNQKSAFVISDSLGKEIGFRNDSSIANMTGAQALPSFTGKAGPPIGYILPVGNFHVVLDKIIDSTVSLTLFGDSTIITYNRSDALVNQKDIINVSKKYQLTLINEEIADKKIDIKIVLESVGVERIFSISKMNVAKDDSVKVVTLDKNNLTLSHSGTGETQFDLVIRRLAQSGEEVFLSKGIRLQGNSACVITPRWHMFSSDSNVKILFDNGRDGTYDDSLLLENQYVSVENNGVLIPKSYGLEKISPNPFNPSTTISYRLPELSMVEIEILNTAGQSVATLVNGIQSAGIASAKWDASIMASGVYLCRFRAKSLNNNNKRFMQIEKLLLVK